MTFAPTICLDLSGIGTVIALLFIAVTATHWITKVRCDRAWEMDIRRRVTQQIDAPWLKMGEPIILHRPDARDTIFKANPYREQGFDPLQWAA